MGNTHPYENIEVGDIKSVIYGALTIQEERAAAYKEFDAAFKRSCATQEDEAFRYFLYCCYLICCVHQDDMYIQYVNTMGASMAGRR